MQTLVSSKDIEGLNEMVNNNDNADKILNLAAEVAIRKHSDDMLEQVLKLAEGKNVAWSDLLVKAAEAGTVDCLQVLWETNKLVLQEVPALHGASKFGNLDCLKFLHDSSETKKILDKADADGQTALHWAVRRNQRPVIEYLLENKVNCAGKGHTESVLHVAASTQEGEDDSRCCHYKQLIISDLFNLGSNFLLLRRVSFHLTLSFHMTKLH